MMGEINVDAMLRRITARQFTAWIHYMQLEPFGELRADYRTASVVQIIANVNRGQKQKAFTLQDCLLKFEEEPKRKQTWQDQQKILMLLAKAYSTSAK